MLRFGVAVDSPSPRETHASPNAAAGCRQAAPGIQPRPVSRLMVGSASQGYVVAFHAESGQLVPRRRQRHRDAEPKFAFRFGCCFAAGVQRSTT